MAKSRGLGKGLKALIPDESFMSIDNSDADNAGKLVFFLQINKIRPNADQPRKKFNREKLEELAASIKEHGILQPLVVRPENNGYTIIAGERRWRAAAMAGLKEVPVIVKDLPAKDVMELALIENVQREDLNAIEEAEAYGALMEHFNLTQGEIGIRIGKSRAAITNTMRLLNLPDKVRQEVLDDHISSGHARALLSLEDQKQMEALCEEIIDKKLSVRETERKVKLLKNPPKEEKAKSEKNPYITAVEDGLKQKFATKVKISGKKDKGKIELEYYSTEDLNRILDLLGYENDGSNDESE
ncbi:chromosome partitioning protein, ParB family [Eubacterium maltosivorans]|uniref:ParB/RepB/Spo0J family partition protein n=1 Tax=Eubacterium maltosivorans TaxID=2041044 RepID=UPI00088153C8|nr:ParB/RepB/Spo0J family partition protein [Eubacterium maltosivorans]WPK82474.1 Stage 0 sporulation protein J [Eubacterium maltosivorans]SDO45876.1 chromosome partitioning protein, ParB family [Eubacterium maltosivorans]